MDGEPPPRPVQAGGPHRQGLQAAGRRVRRLAGRERCRHRARLRGLASRLTSPLPLSGLLGLPPMFVLAEGVAAAALAVVVISAARAARQSGARLASLTGAGFGIAAAVVSWIELALGAWLVYGPVAGRRTAAAGIAYQVLTRPDGVKMFLLAAMAVALSAVALTSHVLPAGWRHLASCSPRPWPCPALATPCLPRALPQRCTCPGSCCWHSSPAQALRWVRPADPAGAGSLTPPGRALQDAGPVHPPMRRTRLALRARPRRPRPRGRTSARGTSGSRRHPPCRRKCVQVENAAWSRHSRPAARAFVAYSPARIRTARSSSSMPGHRQTGRRPQQQ